MVKWNRKCIAYIGANEGFFVPQTVKHHHQELTYIYLYLYMIQVETDTGRESAVRAEIVFAKIGVSPKNQLN